MKIISLMPIKNEAWILDFSLRQLNEISDVVLLLDDKCSDNSIEIAKKYDKCVVIRFEEKEDYTNMSKKRNILLTEGRKLGGTHFIMLDADECFNYSFQNRIRSLLESMKPGQSLLMPWVLIFSDNSNLVTDKKLTIEKDFIYCDDKKSVYPERSLSEGRTPGEPGNYIKLKEAEDSVFHFQYYNEKRTQLKQIWYRCNELIEGKRSAYRINGSYLFTKNIYPRNKTKIEDIFLNGNIQFIKNSETDEVLKEIVKLFDLHGITFFEKLDIWFLKETESIFISRVGRRPKPSIPSNFIIKMNSLKNFIKNYRTIK